jgi:tetratricopeptide (TPR) repeat protein
MKALTAVMKALSVPLTILNLLGAIVSGIWLVIIGEWRPVGIGIFFFFGSSFLLSFALMPGLLLAAPAAWFAAKGRTLGLVLFGALSSIYTLTLITLWCCSVLFLFVKDATASSLIPRLIWSYGIATGPWAYMASQEQGPDGEGFAAAMSTFFAQLAYLVIMMLVLFMTITVLGAIKVFAGFMLVGLVLQITVAVMMEKERKDRFTGIHEMVETWRESAGKEIEIENALFSAFRDKFSEGYGPSGWELCAYADVVVAANIENSHSRSESELPSTAEQIKLAILEVAELAVARQDDTETFELLKMAYSSLARFLPDSKAEVVTARNLGYLSEDPDHPSLRKSTEADQIEAEVDDEESRLSQEFDEMVEKEKEQHTIQAEIERLETEKARLSREKTKIEIEMAKAFRELSPEDPDRVTEIFLEEFRNSSPTEGTSAKYCGDGLIAWRKGDRETALRLYDKAIALDPDDAVALLNRGNLQLEMGRFDAGIADIEEAREMVPELPCENADLFKMLSPEMREEVRQRILKNKDG